MRTVKIDNIFWEVKKIDQGTVWLSEINGLKGMIITEQKFNEINDEPKYKIVYDEMSCYNWGFSINDVWRSGEVEEGVKQPEEDDELLDYLLLKLKEGIKDGTCSFQSFMECFQSDDYEESKGNCETCGHHGGRTTWNI